MSLVRGVSQALVHRQIIQKTWLHISSTQGLSLPSNMQELEDQGKMGFSANRHKEISHGIVQSQPSSMFGGSFMSDQSCLSDRQTTGGHEMVESYESLAAMNLNAVTQTNVPQPFSPSIEKRNSPRLNMPEDCIGQQNKFTASDLQDTLYPTGSCILNSKDLNQKGNYWSWFHIARNPSLSVIRNYSTANTPTSESTKTKLKRAVKDYGATVIVFHVVISIASLTICYAAVASGLDVPGLINRIGFSSELLNSKLASGASTFLVAYAVHKVLVPIRVSITLGSVPFIVRYLRRIGFLKSPTP